MNLNANDLVGVGKNIHIEKELNAQLSDIGREIKDANLMGSSHIIYTLPTSMLIKNMDNKTAQVIIFDGIINELEHQGFQVQFRKINDNTQLVARISWRKQYTDEVIKTMKSNIHKHMWKESS